MTLISLLQSVACVYYRSTVGDAGERRARDRGYVEERSIGFRVRDATGSLRVFPRGARFDAPLRFQDETGTLGDEPAGLDIRRGGSDPGRRGRPRRRRRRAAARPRAVRVVAAGRRGRLGRPAVVSRDTARARRRGDDHRPGGPLLRAVRSGRRRHRQRIRGQPRRSRGRGGPCRGAGGRHACRRSGASLGERRDPRLRDRPPGRGTRDRPGGGPVAAGQSGRSGASGADVRDRPGDAGPGGRPTRSRC